MTDQYAGTAELRTTEALDFEKQDFYSFQIQAISCSGTYADRAYVAVQVDDENEYPPEWESDSLKLTVREGRSPRAPLATLAVRDRDGSKRAGGVCAFRIVTEDQPFRVTERGELWALAPLNYSESHSYVLSVEAEDCAGRRSDSPLLVVVEVRRRCRREWTGVASVASYVPGTGPMPLYPNAKLEMCDGQQEEDDDDHGDDSDEEKEEASCEPASVKATVSLQTSHIGKGCDRDTYR